MLETLLKLTTILAIIFGTVVLGLSAISVYWINWTVNFTYKVHSRQLQALSKRLSERNLDDPYLAKLAAIAKMTVDEMKKEREEGVDKQPQIVQETDDKVPDDKYTKAPTDDDNYKTLAILPEVFSAKTDTQPTFTTATKPTSIPTTVPVPSRTTTPPQTKEADDGHYDNI